MQDHKDEMINLPPWSGGLFTNDGGAMLDQILAKVSLVAIGIVGGAELEDEKDMMEDGFTDDEVDVALALVTKVRGKAVDVLEHKTHLV